ncbi:hypothetical protein SDC9_154440 [bioreactor metagenome]|uniref:Uncharacterized protein n=1 Tax=bioreactor metagenome TaxID=1076179 RepID=A0A645F3I2_9ZZZZ
MHGDGRNLGNKNCDDKFGGLEVADLPLPHDSKANDDGSIQDNRAKYYDTQNITSKASIPAIILKILIAIGKTI